MSNLIAAAVLYVLIGAAMGYRARNFSHQFWTMFWVGGLCAVWPLLIVLLGVQAFWENT